MSHKPYPSDISEEEWHFVTQYLTLMDTNALQRRHDLREVFNALRWLARAGAPWRRLPHDLPLWQMVYQQFRLWDEAGCFEAMVNDMRSVIRVSEGRRGQPSTVILDGRSCRAAAKAVCEAVQEGTGEQARQDAQASEIDLQIVKLPEARKGFVLLPRRWGSSAVSVAVALSTARS